MKIKFSGRVLDSKNFTEKDILLVAQNLNNDALSLTKIVQLKEWLADTGYKVEKGVIHNKTKAEVS